MGYTHKCNTSTIETLNNMIHAIKSEALIIKSWVRKPKCRMLTNIKGANKLDCVNSILYCRCVCVIVL